MSHEDDGYAVGALGIVSKNQEKRLGRLKIRERNKILQTTTLIKSTRILRRVLEIWENLLTLERLWKPPDITAGKTLKQQQQQQQQ